MTRKLILFLVEGITEEISFGLIFSEIFEDKEIEFQIARGDITTSNEVDSRNVIRKINEEIKSFMDREHYKKSDISEIIHLLDTDGAYISEDLIEKHDKDKNYYYVDKLCTRHPENTKKRNNKKSKIMDRLSSHSKINGIPYKAYYLSCNLEHVLHNDANVDDNQKVEKAEEFSDSYFERELEFLDFIRKDSFAVEGEYEETWEFIKQGNNSLNRYSNLHLVFEDF
ncbi:hypothetical protein [Halanaerobium sp. ST460_2HS_T2]|uniref:hypothetical protein n=1 Tax=Halanaerobium sp. ST460_2HS_T2 TaxID=2183914 RepID=UPI000DFEA670|nr:hypothetical protein [Halanaerobium sp. ST460_2HS_T2]RCW58292.1 hypothetical protein DFR80_11145 [Halanaerobium sp. ST460_2HS_T2]